MRIKSFKKLMQRAQLELTQTSDPEKHSVLSKRIDELYSVELIKHIELLNQGQDKKRANILKKIKEIDQIYLESKGTEIIGHVLFSRHGRCDQWNQKKLGLKPNTAIAEDAEQNMQSTNLATGDLLLFPDSLQVAISPMNRAMQTASLLIPKGISNAKIVVEPALTETSELPSGADIRSKADLQQLAKQTSFWHSPIKKIFLKVSQWFYGDEYFKQLYSQRVAAAKKIEAYGNSILQAGHACQPDVCQNINYAGDKIKAIQGLINNANHQDAWLFGHGKNFRIFFSKVLGIKAEFDYAETRTVYKMRANQSVSLYSPPYVFFINQKTGKIEGRYTANAGRTKNEVAASANDIPQISGAMLQLGGVMPQNQKQKEIMLYANPSVAPIQHELQPEKPAALGL